MAFTMSPLLVPSRCDVEVRNGVRSGGRSVLGNEQRVMSDAGFLIVRFEIPVFTPEKVRAYRAMKARLRMGEEIDARVWDNNQPPGAKDQANGAATVVGLHALRATQLTMSAAGVVIDAGTIFAIGYKIHIVTEVISGGETSSFASPLWNGEVWDDNEPWSDTSPSARNVVVKIFPPLRSAVAAGFGLGFGKHLIFRGVLADLSEGDLSLDNAGRNGSATLTIQESF